MSSLYMPQCFIPRNFIACSLVCMVEESTINHKGLALMLVTLLHDALQSLYIDF